MELTLHEFALLIPASFTGLVGFVYMFFRNQLKEKLKRSEIKRLAKDLSQVDGALERAHSFLKEMHQHHSRPDIDHDGSEGDNEGRAVVDLDEEVEHALEVVHEMEMTLDELRSEQSHKERLSPRHKQGNRQV